jgi:beta-xylosidase
MPMRTLAITLLLAVFASRPAAGAEPAATPDKAPARTYRNPLLPDREIADPFVLRVDRKYYLYPTSDSRGYEVFASDDLVHWELKARAFKDPRGGDWAPEVFHNKRGDGKFYLYYTDNMPEKHGLLDKQIGVAVSDSPLGPFEDKAVLASRSIDADLFQDEDGSLYLSYVELAGGFKIIVAPAPTRPTTASATPPSNHPPARL